MAKRRKKRRTYPSGSSSEYSNYYRPRKYKRRKKKKKITFGLSSKQKTDIAIIICFGLACITLLSIFNMAGQLGEFIVEYMLCGIGWQAYIVPFVLLGVCYFLFKKVRRKDEKDKKDSFWGNIIGLFLFVVSLSSLMHVFYSLDEAYLMAVDGKGGGYVGFGFTYPLITLMGFWATLFFYLALFFVSLILVFNISTHDIFEKAKLAKDKIFELFGRIKSKLLLDKKLKVSGLAMQDKSKQELSKQPEDDKDKRQNTEENIEDQAAFDMKVKEVDGGVGGLDENPVRLKSANWKPYPLNLLNGQTTMPTSGDIKSNVAVIQRTLENFHISVDMQGVNVGPTVTQYTLKPAEGVKLSRIISLQNDLALSLAASSIRIEAPIPGKSLVGIEVPNQGAALVRYREILESDEFQHRKSSLSIPLGRDVAGNAVVADLAKMPHLLISGATGAGKSICLNSIILSLLYQNSPDDLKLILVDPKKVEMNGYNEIPHLSTPVITDVDKTINSLKWMVMEMERRLKLFSENGSRDIASYNRKLKQKKVPYLVLIIDELADLMATASNEVEACIVRLAQMARAAGIHLILATQRPSVNVITGLIKANITTRIAFAVASQIDSRTIIDMAGAEKLLGRGDMLYLNSDFGKPKRIQGSFISEDEIARVNDWIKKQGEPEYNDEIIEKKASSPVPGSAGGDADDELFDEAKKIIFQSGKASASLLQRRLRIGYARAARLLDILEEKGIIGPADGAKPREILVDNIEEAGEGAAGENIDVEAEKSENDEAA